MKRSKKWLGAVMAAVMAGGMVLSVNAADNTADDPSMHVKYTEPNVYEITIPSEVTLAATETTATISAETMNIAPDKVVKVFPKSGIENGAVTLTRDHSTDTTTSTVSLQSGGQGIGPFTAVAAFQAQETTAYVSGTLYFSALPADLAAGDWKGQIVFSIVLDNK